MSAPKSLLHCFMVDGFPESFWVSSVFPHSVGFVYFIRFSDELKTTPFVNKNSRNLLADADRPLYLLQPNSPNA